MKKFILPPRLESPDRYDGNKKVNAMIAELFRKSLNSVETAIKTKMEVDYIPSPMVIRDETTTNISYGDSTLGKSGCAVFAIRDALVYSRNLDVTLEEVAQEMTNKGYFSPGQGTCHQVFDHVGARRATHIQEVFDALATRERAIVTMLVRNTAYHHNPNRPWRHFINLVYFKDGKFIVNDSSLGSGIEVPYTTIFEAVDETWIW